MGGQSFLQAVSIRHCNAIDSSGCRLEAPSVSDPEFLTVVDQATNTIYAGNSNLPQIDVFNAQDVQGRRCERLRAGGGDPGRLFPGQHRDRSDR